MKKLIISLLTAALFSSLHAEVFRVRQTVIVPLDSSETKYYAGVNDAVAIMLPEDMTFIQGLEVSIKIPNAAAGYKNTIIYSLYNNISPVPSDKNIDYSGEEIYTGLYPGQLSWAVQIPLVKGNTIKKSPYSDKTLIPDTSRRFVFLRNQLAMKGVPQKVIDSQFELTVKPILSEKGALKIKTSETSSEKNISVTVDDKPVEIPSNGLIMLKAGVHSVSVSSEDSRDEFRTVVIEQAKINELFIDFKSVSPRVHLSVPEGTKVILDGEKEMSDRSFEIESGEHTIRFELGGYSVTKNLTVQEGKTYRISLSVDAVISSE